MTSQTKLIDGKMQHSTQIDDFALEALIVAANELTGLLVRRALIDRASRESGSGMGQLGLGLALLQKFEFLDISRTRVVGTYRLNL